MSKKILLDGCIPQDIPYQCPVCEQQLKYKDIAGWGEYPQSTLRGKRKPGYYGYGFVCPHCFVRSCAHVPQGCDPEEFLADLESKR
jgi:hypothetical protein